MQEIQPKLAWRMWAFSLALICIALVAVSFAVDIGTIGATGRFVWNAIMAALLISLRGMDSVLMYVARRRIWRIANSLTAVGLGYAGNVILTNAQVVRARGWRGNFRKGVTRLRARWNALGTFWKLVIIALSIAGQIALLPAISRYALLIPIGFMIPLVANGMRRTYAWITDSIFAAAYWRYFGAVHRATKRKLRTLAPVRSLRGGIRLVRMRYLAAWRLWKYEPQYRDPTGELWVSLLEPVRLWRQRKLDLYIGRPLFAGKRPDLACRVIARVA